ncbi:MAG: LysM peptidoglycan-binding domain-containing protein [Balneolales bacterium]
MYKIVLFVCFILVGTIAVAQIPTHTVRAGETLFSVSREYDVSVQQLREWNNLDDNTIHVGQRLVVGSGTPSETINDPDSDSEFNVIIHTVEAGQTLFRISRMYGASVEEIQAWNDLENYSISIGQELTIRIPAMEYVQSEQGQADPDDLEQPDPDRETPANAVTDENDSVFTTDGGPALYEVRPGDTLYRIASQFNMSVEELQEINGIDDMQLLVGQELRVRRSPQPPPSVTAEWDMESSPQGKFVRYVISEQDTIQQILQYHKMDIAEFRSLNPGVSVSNIRPGDEVTLLLPATSAQRNPYRSHISEQGSEQLSVSRYSDDSRGSTTTSGELYNPNAMTAAHPSLSLGSVIYVENPENGRGVFVLINDRTTENRLLLSGAAFRALDFTGSSVFIANVHQNMGN